MTKKFKYISRKRGGKMTKKKGGFSSGMNRPMPPPPGSMNRPVAPPLETSTPQMMPSSEPAMMPPSAPSMMPPSAPSMMPSSEPAMMPPSAPSMMPPNDPVDDIPSSSLENESFTTDNDKEVPPPKTEEPGLFSQMTSTATKAFNTVAAMLHLLQHLK